MSTVDLLSLQSNIKKDPDGYKDEFMLQYRHYQALLDIFKLKPAKEGRDFGELVMIMAQVSRCYPKTMAGFAGELCELLDTHYATLEPQLRRTLVGALILMRNRGQVEAMSVLPLFFRLFRVQDKPLRQQLFKHIVADLKAANKKGRNERLNRAVQNFMYGVVSDDNESAAKRGLSVLTELWRRHVWRDARTVNVIASAACHKSSRVMLAVMKFFLGQDKDEEGEGSDKDDDDEEGKPTGPSKEDVYAAYHKGTRSSKKKKQHKLKRVLATVKKNTKRGAAGQAESFAAVHLLHDPQAFAEKLFARLQSGAERFETRLAAAAVVSRVIGMHKLLVLNFYPFLQKYIAPHQRDVTAVLAALAQAVHELVPPETLQPVLRHLVNQFIHDRARPEVVTIGLKAVRELCLRCPLVMDAELLSDLTAYKKYRDKQVSSAARGLIGAFRELYPEMLVKKDRGKGADLALKPRSYGTAAVADRVDGAELLEKALAEGRDADDDDDFGDLLQGGGSDSEDEGGDNDSLSSGDLESLSGDLSDEGDEDGGEGAAKKKQRKAQTPKTPKTPNGVGEGSEGEGGEDDEGDEEGSSSSGWEDVSSGDVGEDEEEGVSRRGSDADEEDEAASASGSGDDEDGGSEDPGARSGRGKRAAKGKAGAAKRQQQTPTAGSLSDLKRRLAEAQGRKRKAEGCPEDEGVAEGSRPAPVHIEMERFLTQEDFGRIKKLKQRALIEAALAKHGLGGAKISAAKRARLLEAAEEEAGETLALQEKRAGLSESKVNAVDLESKSKRRRDKEARLASVMEGRKDRDAFGARTSLKKKKTGGLSEREKQKKKAMPIAARLAQLKRRSETNRQKKKFSDKNFRGHVRG